MRPPGSALLLALAACSIENPAFKAGPQGASGSSEGGSTTGGETDPDVTTGPVTAADATTTTLTSVTGVTGVTGETVSSTEAPTTGTTGTPADLPNACELTVVGEIRKYATNAANGQQLQGCGASETWTGPVTMENGELIVSDAGQCEAMGEPTKYSLGAMYPTQDPMLRTIKCAEVKIAWHPAEPGACRVGAVQVRDVMPAQGGSYPVYAASFNHPLGPPPEGFLLWPAASLVAEPCGCDDGDPGCCGPVQPGEYKFIAGPEFAQVEPGNEIQGSYGGHTYRFLNIQSHIDDSCKEATPDDPRRGYHFDWFLEEFDG